MNKATQDLRREHDSILYVLNMLEKMTDANGKDSASLISTFGEVVYFLKIFADQCHHGKEENYLFQALYDKGISKTSGLVGVMLHEHIQGREFIAAMSRAVEEKDIVGFAKAASQYRQLMADHIQKENNVLFPMADGILNNKEQNLLFEAFEAFEEKVIGPGVHEKLHKMIDHWAESF